LFYIFCSFTLVVCGEKNILPNLSNSQEPEPVFLAPWSRSRSRSEKKYQEPVPEPLWKNQEPEPLEKSQEPEQEEK